MTRAELLVRFARSTLKGLCKNPGVETERSSEQMAHLARHVWDIALVMVGTAPAEVVSALEGDPVPALEASRVRVLLAEGHPYCEKPWRVMHPDDVTEVKGEPQCERCKQLTDTGAAWLREMTEIAANLAAAGAVK